MLLSKYKLFNKPFQSSHGIINYTNLLTMMFMHAIDYALMSIEAYNARATECWSISAFFVCGQTR